MFKSLFLAALLALSLNSQAFAQEKSSGSSKVTPISVSGDKPVEVTGNLNSGKQIALDWAEKSSVACFPATRFDQFRGNHVFYSVTLPASKKIDIKLVPTDKSKVINLYALRQGAGKQAVPPNVSSAISSEARYQIYARKGGKIINTADDGIRQIDFISVNNPYNILIGVAGAEGVKEGEYKLSVSIGDRK